MESGVVSVIATCQKVVGPREIYYREWSGVHYRDLSESSGQTAEARLGRLMERSDFMRNLTEDRPTVDFGWHWGGSSAGGFCRILWKSGWYC